MHPGLLRGAHKTMVSFAASGHYAAFLDDDNRHAPGHLMSLPAGGGSRKVGGPGVGVYAKAPLGVVRAYCFIIDKLACNEVLPTRAMTRFAGGTGGYRQDLQQLRDLPWETIGAHIVYYKQRLTGAPPDLL